MDPNEYSERAHVRSFEKAVLKDALRRAHADGHHDEYTEPNCPDCPRRFADAQ